MKQSTYSFTLDVHKLGIQTRINVKKGDKNSRICSITLMESGNPFPVNSECSVFVYINKPDGKIVYNTCKVQSDGSIRYKISPQAIAYAGTAICELQVVSFMMLDTEPDDWADNYSSYYYEENGNYFSLSVSVPFVPNKYYALAVLYTPSFAITIGENQYDENALVSTDEFSALLDAMNSVKKGVPTHWVTGKEITKSGVYDIPDTKLRDMYLNVDTSDVYEMTSLNYWELKANIKGATGDRGEKGDMVVTVTQEELSDLIANNGFIDGVTYFVSDDTTVPEMKQAIERINTTLSKPVMKLLWENENPESSFGAQTISLDLTKYTGVYIRYLIDKNYSGIVDTDIVNIYRFVPKGETIVEGAVAVRNQMECFRKVTVSDSGVEFEDGCLSQRSNYDGNIMWTSGWSSSSMIPLKIYGLRG